jgi:dihydrofolate reductase
MRKIIAAMNMTLDGFCDHTAMIADEEIHQHYSELLRNAGTLLYGRITFQLMEYWPTLLKNPSGDKAMDEFAMVIDSIPKIVFSNQLKNTGWDSATISTRPIEEVVLEFKQKPGKDILVGSRSLIVQLTNLNLIDELQICIFPVVIGKGLPLFDKIKDTTLLKLVETKTFPSGTIRLCYKRAPQ